jgi:hypothetical protein
MDTGLWTLRCQSCSKPFTLELTAGDSIVDYAKSHKCPSCQKSPDDSPPRGIENAGWHRVTGFQSTKDGDKKDR